MLTFDELRAVLIECQVVTAEQFPAPGPVSADRQATLLDAVGAAPAWWGRGLPKPHPAITDYQRRVIDRRRTTRAALRRGLRLKNYLILDKIGKGGMGVVHKAWDLPRGEFVALKRVIPPPEKARAKAARKRLLQEYQAMTRLAQYPVVVQAVNLVRGRATDVLVMEYQNGGDLAARVAKGGPVKPRLVARWAATLLDGLVAAHAAGLIHRDIKPKNVMIHQTADRELVRLSDWGLVKDLSGDGTAATVAGEVLGSAHYMPPEQWSQKTGPASDIYALGCTLFYVLTGRTPFGDPDPLAEANTFIALCYAHAHAARPLVSAFRPDVPADLSRLVRQMMDQNPRARGTAADLRDAFRRLLSAAPAPIRPPVAAPAPSPAQVKPPVKTLVVTPPKSPHPPTTVRPLTPNEIRARRDQQVPLGAALVRLAAAARAWVASRLADSALAGVAGGELRQASAAFASSLRAWVKSLTRPTAYPGRVATAVVLAIACGGLCALVLKAFR